MESLAAYDNPSFHYFPTCELRRRWASLLHYCDSASAYEDPLYALYGEIFSTLSALIIPHGISSVEPTITNSIHFSYPQCHLVRKHRASRSGSDREMYTIPDFAFIHVTIAYAADRSPEVEKESVVFLTEIKRLYDDSLERQLPFTDSGENSVASISTFTRAIPQLLLQAFCGWHVFNQPYIHLKFICGIYFTLIKFKRPHRLSPLPIRVATTGTGEKRKYDKLVNTISAIKDISNAEIVQWVPEDSVEVIYWNKLVPEDPRNLELCLSAPFRSGLRLCLEGMSSQPSNVFDMVEVQPDLPGDLVSGKKTVSEWYEVVQYPGPRTPPHTNRLLLSDSNSYSPEQNTSPPYKHRPVNVPPLRLNLRSSMSQTLEVLKS